MNKINNILDVYIKSNRLKINGEVNKYNYYDNIFGSCLLAIAANSELDSTIDVSKVLQLLIIDDLDKMGLGSEFEKLNCADDLKSIIEDIHLLKTKESKLAFKYKMIDHLLTRLINEKADRATFNELLDESRIILGGIDDYDLAKCDNIFKFYYINYRLKNKNKHNLNSDELNKYERISEHVVNSMILAILMNSELKCKVNLDRVLEMLVVQELPKSLIGDISFYDINRRLLRKDIEREAASDSFSSLAKRDELMSYLNEFNRGVTVDSQFANYCDAVEMNLQSKINESEVELEELTEKGIECVSFDEDILTRIEDNKIPAYYVLDNIDKSFEFSNKLSKDNYKLMKKNS